MTQITKDNSELIAFVKKWENLIPYIYLDQKGLPTIGIGHLLWNRRNENERYRGVLALHKQYRFKIKNEGEPERDASVEEVKQEFDRLLEEAEQVIQQAKTLASQGPTLDGPGLKPGPLEVPGLSPKPYIPLSSKPTRKPVRLTTSPKLTDRPERQDYQALFGVTGRKRSVHVSPEGMKQLLKSDLAMCIAILKKYWLGRSMAELPECVQIALVDLAFGGPGRVATGGGTYRLLRQAIDQHEWKQAASFIVQLPPNARLARRTARWELVQKAVH